MKTLKKKKLFKNVFYVFGLFCVLALSSCSSYNNVSKENNNNQYVDKLTRKNLTYDDSTYTITFSSNDFNETNYNLLLNYIIDNNYITSGNAKSISGSAKISTLDNTISINSIFKDNSNYVCFGTGAQPLFAYYNSNVDTWTAGNTDSVLFESLVITNEDIYNLFISNEHDNMPQVLNDFVSILVGGITQLATGIANGVGAMASALFLNVNVSTGAVEGLSLFGGIVAIFCGLALAIGITTRVYLWITRLGKD